MAHRQERVETDITAQGTARTTSPAGNSAKPGEDVDDARECRRTRSQHAERVEEPSGRSAEEDEESREHRDVDGRHAKTPEIEFTGSRKMKPAVASSATP